MQVGTEVTTFVLSSLPSYSLGKSDIQRIVAVFQLSMGYKARRRQADTEQCGRYVPSCFPKTCHSYHRLRKSIPNILFFLPTVIRRHVHLGGSLFFCIISMMLSTSPRSWILIGQEIALGVRYVGLFLMCAVLKHIRSVLYGGKHQIHHTLSSVCTIFMSMHSKGRTSFLVSKHTCLAIFLDIDRRKWGRCSLITISHPFTVLSVDPNETAKMGWTRGLTYFDTYAPALPRHVCSLFLFLPCRSSHGALGDSWRTWLPER